MNRPHPSSAEFFEEKYTAADNADPWNFATAAYEQQRYSAVLRALAGRRYRHAFEPGCSIGVLTQRLATMCDAVEACDFSATAAAAASARCADLPNVTVRCEALTANAAWGTYDLILLSEIGYYFSPSTWDELVERMITAMQPGALLLASHWLGTSPDHVQTGVAVHEALHHPLLKKTLHERHEGFVLERWVRLDDDEAPCDEAVAHRGADPCQE